MELQVLVYGKYECFVMQLLDVCVVCVSCGNPQCCILHALIYTDIMLSVLLKIGHIFLHIWYTFLLKWCFKNLFFHYILILFGF